MELLKKKLDDLIASLPVAEGDDLKKRLSSLISVYPFNEFDNEYDFFYVLPNGNEIRIEVKASRAVDATSPEPLYIKALSWDSKSAFDMNFQQIKPKCCDVFVWFGVWRDVIKYWVLPSREVENNRFYSKGQHRGNTDEGQLHIKHDNIKEFIKYEVQPRELLGKIIEAYNMQYFG